MKDACRGGHVMAVGHLQTMQADEGGALTSAAMMASETPTITPRVTEGNEICTPSLQREAAVRSPGGHATETLFCSRGIIRSLYRITNAHKAAGVEDTHKALTTEMAGVSTPSPISAPTPNTISTRSTCMRRRRELLNRAPVGLPACCRCVSRCHHERLQDLAVADSVQAPAHHSKRSPGHGTEALCRRVTGSAALHM